MLHICIAMQVTTKLKHQCCVIGMVQTYPVESLALNETNVVIGQVNGVQIIKEFSLVEQIYW